MTFAIERVRCFHVRELPSERARWKWRPSQCAVGGDVPAPRQLWNAGRRRGHHRVSVLTTAGPRCSLAYNVLQGRHGRPQRQKLVSEAGTILEPGQRELSAVSSGATPASMALGRHWACGEGTHLPVTSRRPAHAGIKAVQPEKLLQRTAGPGSAAAGGGTGRNVLGSWSSTCTYVMAHERIPGTPPRLDTAPSCGHPHEPKELYRVLQGRKQ